MRVEVRIAGMLGSPFFARNWLFVHRAHYGCAVGGDRGTDARGGIEGVGAVVGVCEGGLVAAAEGRAALEIDITGCHSACGTL